MLTCKTLISVFYFIPDYSHSNRLAWTCGRHSAGANVMSSDSDGEPLIARDGSLGVVSSHPVSTYIIVYVIFVVNFVLYII